MKPLRIFKNIVILVVLLTILAVPVYSKERVVCEVDVISDNSAEIALKWSNDEINDKIRIVSWQLLDDKILNVVYESGPNVMDGWNIRRIEAAHYNFPMKIILEDQSNNIESFTDLPTTYEEKFSILNLFYRDIINGYADGTFKPQNNVSRAEFSKMITKTAEYELLSDVESIFYDVNNDHWSINYIMTLADRGILKGRPDGNFIPNGNITIGEVLTVLNRTFMLYEHHQPYPYNLTSHWSNDNFITMVEAGIVRTTDSFYYPYTPDVKATREQCAVLLSRVLEQLHENK